MNIFMMRYGGYRYRMMGYGLGWLIMIGVLIIVVIGIFALIYYFRKQEKTSVHSSLEILNERYAKGEISDEEYTKMKAFISKR